MYSIFIPDDIIEDIFKIKEYIYRMSFSVNTANKIYNEIMASVLTLKVFPSMYPVYQNDLRVLTVR